MNFRERYTYNSTTDLLGEGGFSTIYLANDNLLGRKVALKFFPVSARTKYSVLNEIRRVINLDHPNIARFHDAVVLENTNVHGGTDQVEIGVMEYMDGGDLKSFLKNGGTDMRTISKLLVDILLGIDYLHAHDIVHRDLKPQNILVKNTAQGPVAKLTDFGISKAMNSDGHSSSALLGSIEYMAPEQFNPAKFGVDGKIGTNVDLWSFGILAYEVLCGTSLFGTRTTGQTTEQVMNNILQKEITETDLAHLSEPWKSVIRVCIIKNANIRVRTAREVLSMIEAVAAVQPVSITPPPFQQPLPPQQQQTPQHTVVLSHEQHAKAAEVNVNQTQVLQQPHFNPSAPPPSQHTGQPHAPRKPKLGVFIACGAIALVLIVGLVVYFATRPHIAESAREARLQYEEDKEEGLNSLRHLASAGNDTAFAELADIYYSTQEFDSAAFYFQYMADLLTDRNDAYACYYLMMLEADERLNPYADADRAVSYAFAGSLYDVAECNQYLEDYCTENHVVIDRDYNLYNTVQIGSQEWMQENLQVTCFQNGDSIRRVNSFREWSHALANREPAWCYYEFSEDRAFYGKLYNQYAVTDPQGLAPKGWHIPDNDDWNLLYTNPASSLKSDTEWRGSNTSGFNALPSGVLEYEEYFSYLGSYACWWSSSSFNEDEQYYQYNVYMTDDEAGVNGWLGFNWMNGYNVRCVKD